MDRQNVQTHQLLFYLGPEYKFRVGQIEEGGRDGREGGRERERERERGREGGRDRGEGRMSMTLTVE